MPGLHLAVLKGSASDVEAALEAIKVAEAQYKLAKAADAAAEAAEAQGAPVVSTIGSDGTRMTPEEAAAAAEAVLRERMNRVPPPGVNAVDHGGWTALHLAAYDSNHDAVALLLAAGADPRLRNPDSFTPLELSVQQNAVKCAARLLSHCQELYEAGLVAKAELTAARAVVKKMTARVARRHRRGGRTRSRSRGRRGRSRSRGKSGGRSPSRKHSKKKKKKSGKKKNKKTKKHEGGDEDRHGDNRSSSRHSKSRRIRKAKKNKKSKKRGRSRSRSPSRGRSSSSSSGGSSRGSDGDGHKAATSEGEAGDAAGGVAGGSTAGGAAGADNTAAAAASSAATEEATEEATVPAISKAEAEEVAALDSATASVEQLLPIVERGEGLAEALSSDYLGRLLLSFAVFYEDALMVGLLLDWGANPNLRGPPHAQSQTALHVAAYKGFEPPAATLLAHGAELEPIDAAQATPLHLACYKGHHSMVKWLIQ